MDTQGGFEIKVGMFSFTPTALGTAETLLQWLPRVNASGNTMSEAGLWQEDGSGSANLRNGTSGIMEFSPFKIGAVPEPATLSMLGLGAAMLLGRRNRK